MMMRMAYLALLVLHIAAANTTIGQISFFDGQCPSGWEVYKYAVGRTIIGNGTYNSARLDGKAEQKTYSIGQVGGEMEHKLTTDEIPAHDHSNGQFAFLLRITNYDTCGVMDYTLQEPDVRFPGRLQSVGKDVPHNNMPPYLVLNICKKLPDGYVSTPNGTVKVDVTDPATSSINLANDDKGYGLTGVIISALSLFISAILAIDKLVNRKK